MELKNWTCKIFFDPWFQYITSEEARMLNGRGMSHTRIFTLFNCLVPKFNHPYRYICKTSINRAVLWIRLMRVYVTLLLSQPSLALLLRELVTRKWGRVVAMAHDHPSYYRVVAIGRVWFVFNQTTFSSFCVNFL